MVIAFGHSVCIGNHMISSAIWNKSLVQFGVFEEFTSTYLFQTAREKSCDYLLITYMKKCKMVKKKKCMHNYPESGKN